METTRSSVQDDTISYINVEKAARESSIVHWPSIFAGLFVAMIVYYTLLSMGIGMGASHVANVMRGDDPSSAVGKGLGVWFALSVIFSLFAGSFAASRVSGLITTRVGYIQGAVVSALFFTVMLSQIGAGIGLLGHGTAALAGAVQSASENPQVNAVVEDSLGDLHLKSPPETVISGVASRLVRGDNDSAVNYLAYQSGISKQDARVRLERLRAELQAAGQKMADTAKNVAWLSFGILLFGSLSGLLGGGFGAQLTLRKPIDELDRKAMHAPSHA